MHEIEPDSVNERYRAYLNQAYPRQSVRRRFILLAALFLVLLFLTEAALKTQYSPLLWAGLAAAVLLRGVFALNRALKAQRQVRRLHRIAQHGKQVTAYLVQANASLFKPGTDTLPALVLFSLQPEVGEDAEYMRFLARRVARLKGTRPIDVDGRLVAGMVTNERAVFDRRRRLPISFTDGSTVYCADLWIRRSHLPDPTLTVNVLPCLAEPGENGGIELLPAWLLSPPSSPAPTRSHQKF